MSVKDGDLVSIDCQIMFAFQQGDHSVGIAEGFFPIAIYIDGKEIDMECVDVKGALKYTIPEKALDDAAQKVLDQALAAPEPDLTKDSYLDGESCSEYVNDRNA